MKNGSFQNGSVIAAVIVFSSIMLAGCGSGSPASSAKGAGSKNAQTNPTTSGSASDPGGTASLKPYNGNDTIIASSNQKAGAVTLNIIGGQTGASSGFNFNGYSKGNMVIKVPEGWKVTIHFSVQSSLAHSAIIAPWSEREASSFHPAFAGSAIPNYTSGINKTDKPIAFSFTADHAGQYAIVCAVPGHDDLGMWDEFDVVSDLKQPEVLVK